MTGATLSFGVACRDDPDKVESGRSRELLTPFSLISAETDTSLGLISRISTSGCAIAIYDHSVRRIAIRSSDSLQWIGRRGSGPGEISHAYSVALSADRVHAIDWVRGRQLIWDREGKLIDDRAATHHVPRHAYVGPTVALPGGELLDYPFGGFVGGIPVPWSAMSEMPLVYRIGSDGAVRARYGSVEHPPDSTGPLVNPLWQIGDLAVNGDSLVILRHANPRVLLFSLKSPSRRPILSIDVTRLRPLARATRTRLAPNDSLPRMTGVTVEQQTSAVAIGPDGSIYTILRQSNYSSDISPTAPWPKEQLFRIRPGTTTPEASGRLDGVNSRSLAFLEDGTMVRLYMRDSTGGGGFDIGLYRLPSDLSAGNRCKM